MKQDQKTPFKPHFTKRDIETHGSQTVTESKSNLQNSKSPLPCYLVISLIFKYNCSKSEIVESH